ncbi:MAG TPA: ArsR family transcriptional regulator, partial [Gemmatimonadaceae bacterium]
MVAALLEEVPLSFLQLVADTLRWQLLGELARSDRRVGELAQITGKAQNLVSYHLGELRSAELVSARRSSADGRDTYYRLNLARCGELFVTAGAALHPGLELAQLPMQPPPRTKSRHRWRVLFLCTGNSSRS